MRKKFNPEASIILAHNFKGDSCKLIDADPFYFYSQITMQLSKEDTSTRMLCFDLLHEANFPDALIEKVNGIWQKMKFELTPFVRTENCLI